ncbi:recombinase family protein [Geobacillus kaustophilus]|uniref:recombinase family protein n=1 Tax=Geobacillus kaustophilus TaxID=1462 RepID=UPI0005CCB444|nr:recombinase family protein [Geobacillus kaustophilus]
MKVAIYVRVSTEEQAKEGFSIPAQRERLRAFCTSQGWEIVQEYIEEGWSAKDLERPQMQRLLKDIKKGNIDIVLVYRLDRLTRSVLDLYLLLQTFEKYNVAFRSATEVYDTSTAMGRLFITLVAALAQWERENLAERVKFGIEQMIDEGKKPGGHSPYGYKFDKDFNCTIIEDEANVVRMIYRMYCDGYGYHSIAKRLNELGIKPRIAKEWNRNSIRDILTNDIYIGVYRWGSKAVYNNHPPIISEALFRKAQKEREKKKVDRTRVGKFLLTGLLHCGNCGEHKMQGSFDKREQKIYYRCTKCNRITNEKNILEPLLDEIQLLITSKEYFMSKFANRYNEQESADISVLTKELEKIKRQKEKWYDLYMDENNPIPKEDLFAKINELNKREEEIYQKLSEVEPEEQEPVEEKYNRLSAMADFKEQFNQANDFTKKELLFSIFEKIVISREKGKLKKLTIDYTLK